MRRKTIVFFLVQVLFAATFSCKRAPKECWSLFDLKGKVRRVTTEVSYEAKNANSKPNRREVYNFNESGQIVERMSLEYDSTNGDYILASKIAYTYQRNGLLEFEETFNADGDLETKFKITKHSERLFPLERELVSGTSATKITSNYLPKQTEEISYYEGMPVDKRTKVYDDNANVTLEWLIYYDEEGDSSIAYGRSYEYIEFDKVGNWTKRIALPKGLERSTLLEGRTITYF
jgi:hypothetical protein